MEPEAEEYLTGELVTLYIEEEPTTLVGDPDVLCIEEVCIEEEPQTLTGDPDVLCIEEQPTTLVGEVVIL